MISSEQQGAGRGTCEEDDAQHEHEDRVCTAKSTLFDGHPAHSSEISCALLSSNKPEVWQLSQTTQAAQSREHRNENDFNQGYLQNGTTRAKQGTRGVPSIPLVSSLPLLCVKHRNQRVTQPPVSCSRVCAVACCQRKKSETIVLPTHHGFVNTRDADLWIWAFHLPRWLIVNWQGSHVEKQHCKESADFLWVPCSWILFLWKLEFACVGEGQA